MMTNAAKPILLKTIVRIQYAPTLSFFQKMYSAAEGLVDFRDWETDNSKIIRKDYLNRCSIYIGFNQLIYDQDSSDEILEQNRVSICFPHLISALNIAEVVQFSYKRIYILPVKLSFDKLNEILNVKLFSQNSQLLNILPKYPHDLKYVFNGSDDENDYLYTIAPIWRSQLESEARFNKQNHLSPFKPEQDYSEVLKSYPDSGVYLDLEISQRGKDPFMPNNIPYLVMRDLHSDKILKFIHQSRTKTHQFTKDIVDYIFKTSLDIADE